MRLIHRVPFTPSEIEFYRQLVFSNLTYGLSTVLEALDDLQLALSPRCEQHRDAIENAPDIKDGEAYPPEYRLLLEEVWGDENVRRTVGRGNEYALPEKCVFPSSLSWVEETMLMRVGTAWHTSSARSTASSPRATHPPKTTSCARARARRGSPRRRSSCASTRCSWSMSAGRRASGGSGYIVFRM